jgi:hypothetical protein
MGWYAEHEAFHAANASPECRPFCHMDDMTLAVPLEVVRMVPNRALLFHVLGALCPQLAVKPAEADMLWLAAHGDKTNNIGQIELVAPAPRGMTAAWDCLHYQTGWNAARMQALKVLATKFARGPRGMYHHLTPSTIIAMLQLLTPMMKRAVATLCMEVINAFEGTKDVVVKDASPELGTSEPKGSIFAWTRALPRRGTFRDFKAKYANLMTLIPAARHLTFEMLARGAEPMAFLGHVAPNVAGTMLREGLTPATYAHYMAVLDFLRAESLARLKLFARKTKMQPLTVVYPNGTRQRALVSKDATMDTLASHLAAYRSTRTGRTEWDGPYAIKTFCGVEVGGNTVLHHMPRNVCLYAEGPE